MTSPRADIAVAALCALFVFGCAASGTPTLPDGGDGDADVGLETGLMDTSMDTGIEDTGTPDTGPPPMVGTCEECTEHAECGAGSFCATLTGGEQACVPGCNIDLPDCPRSFNCVLDFTTGVESAVCVPVGALCCVDEDADEHGQGIGCLGPDCNDEDELINPSVAELCDGIDQDCDGSPDDPPTDCASGRCADEGDGTYSAVTGADCVAAMCEAGTTTDCELRTCVDGGEDGTTCATTCSPAGVEDELFCVESAHCDGTDCLPDVVDGGVCDEDTDCAGGHCGNGFCCDSGACCNMDADCPGGGSPTTLCDDASTCQGTRGETTCSATFQCETVMGIEDDSACDSGVLALDCSPYDPIHCDGTTDQPAPSCPRSCLSDSECVDAAHCELGVCIPDRPAGGLCSRQPECAAGLFCVDSVCCGSTCTGTCEACNLPGTMGACTAIPATADPSNECVGFSCGSYYSGFMGGSDVCSRRQDVSDSQAACNGAGACINPTTLCSMQPPGTTQIDCDNTCQAPVSGTCTGMTPGMCRDLDDPLDTTTCGVGTCERTVQRCSGGAPNTCTPGAPSVEICNALDDDCDGTPDDGTGASLCPPAPFATTYMCTAGTCSFSCQAAHYDLNSTYADGCECQDDAHGNACGALTVVGTLNPGDAATTMGTIVPTGEEDWFEVNFPSVGRGPANGTPTINLTGPNAANFELDFFMDCAGSAAGCQTGSATAASSFTFTDDVGPDFLTNATSWPTTVVFRVRRVISTTSCGDASYQVSVTR